MNSFQPHAPNFVDRELIKAAALAAGLDLGRWDEEHEVWVYPFRSDVTDGHRWNPLTDDGDALRLAVKLGVRHWRHDGDVIRADLYWRDDIISDMIKITEPINGDPYAATRRAIVRASAVMSAMTYNVEVSGGTGTPGTSARPQG